MSTSPRTRLRPPSLTAALLAVAGLVLTACGGTDTESTPVGQASDLISAERCAANQAAGKITVLSSFDLGGTVTNLGPVVAKSQGLFEDLCLQVDLKPKTDNNAQLVSAGTAQIASFASAGDLMIAQASGAKITGISTYGSTPMTVLMTRDDGSIGSLRDLEGKTVGYKVIIPAQLTAMLATEGVDESKINFVSVGFDPSILPNGQVDALTGFRDNEPNLLATMGESPKLFKPEDYGVAGTMGVQGVNTEWGSAHPTAVEDFLRASLYAIDWIQHSDANLDQAIQYSKDMSPAGYNVEQQTFRWRASLQAIESTRVDGRPLGHQTPEMWQPEADLLVEYGTVQEPLDVHALQTNAYIDAIYRGDSLVWPPAAADSP